MDQVLELKKRCCQACGKAEDLNIDHCHNTGVIRGVLCTPCNHILGRVNDNPEILRALIQYLESHQTKTPILTKS